jgi:YVTN family beta-propeller protein
VATITTVSNGFVGEIAITPDGKQAYVADGDSPGTVSVIDTATNAVVATVPVGSIPEGVAITPDGKHAYVTNNGSNTVSVIRTATSRVEAATIALSAEPFFVGIVPPPPGVPFLAFSATALDIAFGTAPNEDFFNLHSQFTLSSTAPGLHPHRDPVTLSVGTFSITMLIWMRDITRLQCFELLWQRL